MLPSKPRLFADDTCLLVKGLNTDQLQIKVNRELQNLPVWCSVIKLLGNPTKTNIAIIPLKQTSTQLPHLNITSNGSPENVVSSAKYLGVIIDNDFNFNNHITGLERRVVRSIGILSKWVLIFSQNIMLQLYHALMYLLILYGIAIWENTFPSYLERLKPLQN